MMDDIECAILEALAYSDIFEYPLTLDELHRFLPAGATKNEIEKKLHKMTQVDSCKEYYFLKGNHEIVDTRLERTSASLPTFKLALHYGRILGSLPFVRMVGMTGSLAVMNLSKGADMDYMLITQPKRLWTARAFAVTFGRLMRLFEDRICVNLLISETALPWPVHDLYSAREMCQMIPVTGIQIYRRLRKANPWTEEILPNSQMDEKLSAVHVQRPFHFLQNLLELPLRGTYGGQLEKWCMKFQTRRFGHHESDEVNFTEDVCQGNFHSHRKWAGKYFRARLITLGLIESSSLRMRGYP